MKRLLTLFLILSLLTAICPISAEPIAEYTLSISNIMVRTGEEVSVWYYLGQAGQTSLALIDENGQTKAELFNEWQEAGSHEYLWDGTAAGSAFPSGQKIFCPGGQQLSLFLFIFFIQLCDLQIL